MHAIRQYWRDYRDVLGVRRGKLVFVVLLMIGAGALDFIGVGLVAPLLASLSPDGPAIYGDFLGAWSFWDLAVLLILVFIFKGIAGVLVQRAIAAFAHRYRARLVGQLLDAYQKQPLEYHLTRSSSESLTLLTEYTNLYCESTLSASLRLLTEVIVFLAIGGFLAFTDWRSVLIMVGLLTVVLWVVNRVIRNRTLSTGQKIASHTVRLLRDSRAALSGYRDLRVLNVAPFFRDRAGRSARDLAESRIYMMTLSVIPRYCIEISLVFFLVVLSGYSQQEGGNIATLLPQLGLFAVGALRLMPASTAIMRSVHALRSSRYVLGKLAEGLRDVQTGPKEESLTSLEPITTFQQLQIQNISYRYPQGEQNALDGLSLSLDFGETIGIVGRSGAGKSTLADVLLGLLKPFEGKITIDGEQLMPERLGSLAAYIPQQSFIVEDTVAANVALGIPADRRDIERVWQALKMAEMQDIVEALPQQLDTELGENGVRLSGGQRQRIALARALYFDRKLIVLDEATSALDAETETRIVDALESLHGSRTIVVIAHRYSTIRHCDRVLALQNGKLLCEGTLSDLMKSGELPWLSLELSGFEQETA